MKRSRPTLRDVAALAGVSHQTVSRVINGSERVSDDTRRRVEQAIGQLGFLPNAIARSMAQGRTHMLACITPSLIDFTFSSLVEGAEAVARQSGYFLISAVMSGEEDFDRLIGHMIGNRRVDGVLIASPYLDDRHAHFPPGIPVVVFGGTRRPDVRNLVYLDNREAAAAATTHLIELGHKRIAQLTGPLLEDCSQQRHLGFLDALASAGIAFEPELTGEGDWSATSGYQFLSALAQNGGLPTAVVSQNDRMAVGMIHAARVMGIRVPEDLSIIGFDDMPLASYFDPPLTTIRQDTFAYGQTAAALLLNLIDQEEPEPQVIRNTAQLIVRNSTSRPSA